MALLDTIAVGASADIGALGITGPAGALAVTVPAAALDDDANLWAPDKNRQGQVTFQAIRTFNSGAMQALFGVAIAV
jgi:hypothetical protein